MSATVHSLHPVLPIGHFLRVGHTGHRKLEDFDRGRISAVASGIADFAVHHRVGVVLAPT